MMRQFLAAKTEHPDAIVLFRMGDFYETFFEDAVEAARLLELTLTSRNKGDENPIPMAGVPHHAARGYIRRLVEAGRKVAICEQVEDPRTAKGLVRRAVVRVVTPGVVLDDDALDSRRNNFLVAVWRRAERGEPRAIAIAIVDASTGEVRGTTVDRADDAVEEIGRIDPAEILIADADEPLAGLIGSAAATAAISRVPAPPPASEPLAEAEEMLHSYVARTQPEGELLLKPAVRYEVRQTMRLAATAVRNLELVRTIMEGGRRGSLLGLIDLSRTAMGGRLLRRWLLYPLTEVERIHRRQAAVAAFAADPMLRSEIREVLASVRDLERLVTRVVAGAAAPRDLVAVADSLEAMPRLRARLLEAAEGPLAELADGLDPVESAASAIRSAIVDEPPATLKDGGVIREGFDPDLDELLEIARDGKQWFNRYAESLRESSGITSLKIRFNNVFGYFIEVTKANLHLVPDTWLRKQTLASAERYYTPDLKEREEKVLSADDRRILLEQELFDRVRLAVAAEGRRIQRTAGHVAALDALVALAEVAQRRGYVRPEVDDSLTIEIEGGRHPVIEALVPHGEFVPNDITLCADERQIVIITGPNMAGKSTVMRQTALITVLAQMGSFVPADRARIGVVDQVFTRVGASDNLARGQSTFMVEMNETSDILDQATSRSLIVLDEIGRGTSTYDGVSIAWAVAEFIHDQVGARTLFATHYHELTELAATRERVANMTIAVKEWQDDIVFLRKLVPGGSNRSYGIQVGRLAGLPHEVVERAKEILATLEQATLARDSRPRLADRRPDHATGPWQLSLFAPPAAPSPVEQALETVDPDQLTPREALDLLYELKAKLD